MTEKKEKTKAGLMGLLAFALLLSILASPGDSYRAALVGLDLWLKVVFPALLPFFIASELMIGLGVVDFFAVLLNPLMGPLFKSPGNSSFIWAMSVTSGYPVGARLVSLFRQQGRITVKEGQRILSFCSTSGPLFMMGAVAVGMLGSMDAGRIIMISHYIAAIGLGLLFRSYGAKDSRKEQRKAFELSSPLSALYHAKKRDGRGLGQLMGDSVKSSVNILLMVGGFIILFSVIIDLFVRMNIIGVILSALSLFGGAFGVNSELISGVAGGFLEITVGSRMISQAPVTLQQKIAAVSLIIGWSGFSIHAQTASILSGSGIRFGLYLLIKLAHGVLAAIISYPLTLILYPKALEVFKPGSNIPFMGWGYYLASATSLLLWSIMLMLCAGLLFWLIAIVTSKK